MQSFIGLALTVPEIIRGAPKEPPRPLNGKKSLARLGLRDQAIFITGRDRRKTWWVGTFLMKTFSGAKRFLTMLFGGGRTFLYLKLIK